MWFIPKSISWCWYFTPVMQDAHIGGVLGEGPCTFLCNFQWVYNYFKIKFKKIYFFNKNSHPKRGILIKGGCPFIWSFLAISSHHPMIIIAAQQRTLSKRRVLSNLMLWGNVFSFIVACKTTLSSRKPISSSAIAPMASKGFKSLHLFSCVLVY